MLTPRVDGSRSMEDSVQGRLNFGRVVFFGVVVVCVLSSGAFGQPWDGNGVEGDPYQIWTAEDMQAIGADSNYWDAHFELMADIDLSEYAGTSFNIIGERVYDGRVFLENPFSGVFDGNGHTISNFTYERTSTDTISCIGLFGYIDDPNAEVRNLGLIEPNIHISAEHGALDGGSLAGFLRRGTIVDCYAEGGYVIGDSSCGGLVGNGDLCNFLNCHFEGTVTGGHGVGGLIGGAGRSIFISNCYSSGSVSGEWYAGGLIGGGHGTQAYISDCYSTSNVTGIDYVGGLTGRLRGIISSCYSTGSVIGYDDVGGLVGLNGCSITSCYSAGSVSGTSDVGGLVGDGNPNDVTDSYWDVNSSGQIDSSGGQGKTTEQMQDVATFTVWSCEAPEVWTIDDGNDYPRLWWENKPGGLLKDVLYGDGGGTESEPYLIYTAKQLNTVGSVECNLDKHFKLMADIDLSEFTGDSFNVIGHWIEEYISEPFVGTFDGNGHAISNFTYDSNSVLGGNGLFGAVGSNGCVKNLGLIDIHVSGSGSTGGLVGSLRGNVMNCYSTGSVTGNSGVGGLVGSGRGGNIQRCFSTCEVAGDYGIGGLVGYNIDYYISVSDCYSTGRVIGDSAIGGLVGYFRFGDISRCYSTSAVDGNDYVGGLIGYDYGETYANCFWDVNVNPDVNGIGNNSDPNVVGLPTAEMQTESTFTDAGWDFVGELINGPNDIWEICEGTNYPKFVWQIPVGDMVCPDGVNFEDYAYFAEHWYETDYGDVNGVELTGDGRVNWEDFGQFAGWWMVSGCGECGGADFTGEGDVDYLDLDLLAGYWLGSEYGDCGGAELTGDGIVEVDDLREFTENWLTGI